VVGNGQPAPETDSFEIVVVCTGNRARSPLVEAFIRQLTVNMPVRVESAGTQDVGAVPAMSKAVSAAGRWGIDLSPHQARNVRGIDLSDVDLVLGFELSHISTAVVECGALRERTFTLPELVALLELVERSELPDLVQRARARVFSAHEARGRQNAGQIPEIADPLDANQRQFGATTALLRDLSYRLVVALFSPRT
jgi:protein-tyrosine phosphatase